MSEIRVNNIVGEDGVNAPNLTAGLNVTGIITATTFATSGLNISGVVTATSFSGSGSSLTGVLVSDISNLPTLP